MERSCTPPVSVYRLQLNKAFPLSKAIKIVPYLSSLGIKGVYLSPIFQAITGSTHGYDVTCPLTLNPDVATDETFDAFSKEIKKHGMQLILDWVANHMGADYENPWWRDVMENGEGSLKFRYFDINWRPIRKDLHGKVMVPLLDAPYMESLEEGAFKLHDKKGAFDLHVHGKRFPINPNSYPLILHRSLSPLKKELGKSHPEVLEMEALLDVFKKLPEPKSDDAIGRHERNLLLEGLKERLSSLYAKSEHVMQVMGDVVETYNATSPVMGNLLDKQHFHLSYWQEAPQGVNYRRFFDISILAALRIEDDEVFDVFHSRLFEMIEKGQVDGLRVDHPDGLRDPARYFERLQEKGDLYVVVEKILGENENLPEDWDVDGSVGYEFLNDLSKVYTDPLGEDALTGCYHKFIEKEVDHNELLYKAKRQFALLYMTSELESLAHLLYKTLKKEFALESVKEVCLELLSLFPVYRSYVRESTKQLSQSDRALFETVFARIEKGDQDPVLIKKVKAIFFLEEEGKDFLLSFQQLSPVVMAKGLEDTVFYTDNRFIAHNEVGGELNEFSLSLDVFHQKNKERANMGFLTTSTHDTKRSEDMRMRLVALSFYAEEWSDLVQTLAKINTPLKRDIGHFLAPDKNTEYFLYQTLFGVVPKSGKMDMERIKAYMIKAVREAKAYTNWINQDINYENALLHFIDALSAEFWNAFLPFHDKLSTTGEYLSLSSLLVKVASPGVFDLYQGCEVWNLHLVDPDNRSLVDYQNIQKNKHTKFQLVSKGLTLRAKWPELFLKGSYEPLDLGENVIAFKREHEGKRVIAVALRFPNKGYDDMNLDLEGKWCDLFTGEESSLKLSDILSNQFGSLLYQ